MILLPINERCLCYTYKKKSDYKDEASVKISFEIIEILSVNS